MRIARVRTSVAALIIVCAVCCSGASVLAQELRRSGFLGVQVVDDPDSPDGVRVQGLVEGGTAKEAGILQNDIILRVGQHAVTGVADFVQTAKRLRAGDGTTLTVSRGGRTLTLDLVVKPRPLERSSDAAVRYDAVRVDGTLRRTIVTAPLGSGRHPALLYVNGIGCFSQESLDLSSNDAKFLYGLTRSGFVTMRLEKSGAGDSEGPPCDSPAADFDAEVRAYTAALRALKAYAFVDSQRVFLVGLSIGGVEAPLIAAEEAVRGLVVINTVAKPFLEYLLETRRRQLVLSHTPDDEIDRRMALDERCNHQLLIDAQPPERILDSSPACAEAISYPAPFTFMRQWASINVGAAWKAVAVPVLVVHGGSDFVSTIEDGPYLTALINSFRPGTATFELIPGMDHGLNKAASMAESVARRGPGEFEPAVLSAIASWLERRSGS